MRGGWGHPGVGAGFKPAPTSVRLYIHGIKP